MSLVLCVSLGELSVSIGAFQPVIRVRWLCMAGALDVPTYAPAEEVQVWLVYVPEAQWTVVGALAWASSTPNPI